MSSKNMWGDIMREKKKLLAVFLLLSILITSFQGIGNIYAQNAKSNSTQQTELRLEKRGVSTLKLSWSKIEKAKFYEIYRLNTSTKKYEKIGTTTETKYTDKNLKSASSYYYKVKPCVKSLNQFSNELKLTTKPFTPKVSLKLNSSSSFTATWTNVSSRNSGYQVYMSTSKDGKYNLIGSTTEKTFTVDELENNKTYYIKVRAFKTVDK